MRGKTLISLALFTGLLGIALGGPVESLSPGAGQDVTNIVKKVYPSVVKVEARNSIRKVATGVVLDNKGHIVTTALITPHDEEVYIITSDGDRIEAEFLGLDAVTHLAVVKAKEGNFRPVDVGRAKDLSAGTWIGVVSISPENDPAVTQGVVSSVAEDGLRLNVWVIRGSSGSPVVDNGGRMIGLLRGVYTDESPILFEFREQQAVGTGMVFSQAEAPSSGLAMAVPVETVERVSSEIIKNGKVERGWLGVQIVENEDGGVEIVGVDKESPAELGGLEEGDIIREFEGKEINSTEMLAKEIRMRKPGETVSIQVLRGDKTERIRVKLGESESEMFREFQSKFPRLFRIPEGMKSAPEIVRPRVFPFPVEKRKFIGVYLEELNEDLSSFFGVEEGLGLLVSRLEEDSPAVKAGLKVGDVIVKADGKSVDTIDALSELIQGLDKGETVTIEYIRDKKLSTVEVEVEEEETSGPNFFRGTLDDVRQQWREFSESARRRTEPSRSDLEENARKNAERLRRQVEELTQKAREKAKDGKDDAENLFIRTLKKYRGIKV